MYQYHSATSGPGMDVSDAPDPTTLVRDLANNDDPVRKMAAFKLQSAVGDPSFADRFVQEGGLAELRALVFHSSGNTLAYSLASFYNILDLDLGWTHVDEALIKRLVQLVVAQPLVNILRGAMSILVAILSRSGPDAPPSESFGFPALKPAIELYPQFLEMLVSRLSSADHALCANALQLINLLMRDAVTNESDAEWPKFVKQIQELGVIKAVYVLMQASSIHDLAPQLLEFQALTKLLLKKWKEIPVNMETREHRVALRALHLASNAEKLDKDKEPKSGSRKHIPYEWRRLGFDTESPMYEFDNVGYLGMMDLNDFVRKSEDGFQKLLLEQSGKPPEQRCPIAKASLAMTSILYDHFEVEDSEQEDQQRYATVESRSNIDKAFKPLLLQWSRLHTSGLQAFLRLWAATGAEKDDFNEMEELVRILIEQVLDSATRTKGIMEVEDELAEFELQRLRELQMDLLELTHEDAWGHHLGQVREELHHEALQFIKEQRIRCLLAGTWFPTSSASASGVSSWRCVRLAPNRRYLHYDDFGSKPSDENSVGVDALDKKIDLSVVSSVVSSVFQTTDGPESAAAVGTPSMCTEIVIHGHLPPSDPAYQAAANNADQAEPGKENSDTRKIIRDDAPSQDTKEVPLLSLYPQTHTNASEWLDGLLMLLNQQPITSETNKLVEFIAKYGLRIRLLNVRFEEALSGVGARGADGEDDGGQKGVYGVKEVELPSRDGVDEEYYYEIGGM